jgi:DNA primase
LPRHPKHDGKKRTPSFSAHLGKGLFNCFGCHASGNLLEFAVLMSGTDPNDSAALREVALELQDRLLVDGGNDDADQPARPSKRRANEPPDQPVDAAGAQQKPSEVSTRPVVVNAPLDFTLKMLDVEHPYLKERRFTSETISHFGLGYCSRGLMQGRIAIPLHDTAGRLIGYAGRLVDDAAIDEDHPKYRFPSSRERDGKVYEFHKTLLVHNLHALTRPVDDLVVCEGFASVWWCWQCGVTDVVAVMGSSCSPEQGRLIANAVSLTGRVWVLPDADAAGEHCARSVFAAVGPHRAVRWAKLTVAQPTDLSEKELQMLLS